MDKKISKILKALSLGLSVGVIVCFKMAVINIKDAITLLAIAVAALSIANLNSKQ